MLFWFGVLLVLVSQQFQRLWSNLGTPRRVMSSTRKPLWLLNVVTWPLMVSHFLFLLRSQSRNILMKDQYWRIRSLNLVLPLTHLRESRRICTRCLLKHQRPGCLHTICMLHQMRSISSMILPMVILKSRRQMMVQLWRQRLQKVVSSSLMSSSVQMRTSSRLWCRSSLTGLTVVTNLVTSGVSSAALTDLMMMRK